MKTIGIFILCATQLGGATRVVARGGELTAMITGQTVVGTVLAAGGLAFLSVMLTGLWLGYSSRRWPTTEGEILDSRAELDPTSEAVIPAYRPKVRYRYQVSDREYTSAHFTYMGYTMAREVVEGMVGRDPIGSRVQVHYHPRQPSRAVLEPGTTLKKYLIPMIVAAWMIAAGITALLGIGGPSGD